MATAIALYDVPVRASSPSDILNQLSSGVSVVKGQKLNAPARNATVSHKVTTGLIAVLFVILLLLFFPLALLVLLARPTETITIHARAVDGVVRVSATGDGDPKVVAFLNEYLRPVSDVAVAA